MIQKTSFVLPTAVLYSIVGKTVEGMVEDPPSGVILERAPLGEGGKEPYRAAGTLLLGRSGHLPTRCSLRDWGMGCSHFAAPACLFRLSWPPCTPLGCRSAASIAASRGLETPVARGRPPHPPVFCPLSSRSGHEVYQSAILDLEHYRLIEALFFLPLWFFTVRQPMNFHSRRNVTASTSHSRF